MTASPGRQYTRKLLTVLPVTFLFAPLFYSFLGYHPDMPVLFPVLVYIWHALFVFLGATLAFNLKKYRYFAYLLILAAAFFCRHIISAPWLHFQKPVLFITEEGFEVMKMTALEAGDLAYYSYMLFISTFISGSCGIFYSRKPPLDFVQKNNTFLFCNIFAASAIYYMFTGIMETDKNAGVVFAFYMTGFAVSYFIVRSFAYINRELDVYGEMGAYNISGTDRIYAYYFSMLSAVCVLPVFFGVIVIPFLINMIKSAAAFIAGWLVRAILAADTEANPMAPDVDFGGELGGLPYQESDGGMTAYYILVLAVLAITITLIIIFRKKIAAAIKRFIFKMGINPKNQGLGLVIDEELITKAEKEKKSRPSYRDYLKKAKKIKELRAAFLFLYSYIFWNMIKKDGELKQNSTPYEFAEKYPGAKEPADLYCDMEYGQKTAESGEILTKMTAAESFLREYL
ncbi:MAG: hypothetical protein FWD23_16935 [Oscillospiraceae bacterium]|nr:hypothetical protein [Oscillospiraceae bacterium]